MNNNRKIRVSVCFFLILLVSLSVNAYAVNDDKAPMLKAANAIRDHINNHEADNERYIGDVNGELIYNDEFELRYNIAISMGSDTPYEDTINSLKLLKAEKQFADDNNISVTESEVIAYTNKQRDIVENQADADLRNGIKAYISELGMSEDEYWTTYKFEENSKYLLHLKVANYQKQNNIKADVLDNVLINITDRSYQKDNIDCILD